MTIEASGVGRQKRLRRRLGSLAIPADPSPYQSQQGAAIAAADKTLAAYRRNREWDPLESTCRHASLSIL